MTREDALLAELRSCREARAELERLVRDLVADDDRRRGSRRGRVLLWLLRKLT